MLAAERIAWAVKAKNKPQWVIAGVVTACAVAAFVVCLLVLLNVL